jgi:hypothetical protein
MPKQIVEVIYTCDQCSHCDNLVHHEEQNGKTVNKVIAICDRSNKQLPAHGTVLVPSGGVHVDMKIPEWCTLGDYKEESIIIIPG